MSIRHTKKTRITITLPPGAVEAIDRIETNRSRFVLEAVTRELTRRRRERLRESLEAPHAESAEIAEEGLEEWRSRVSDAETDGLLVKDGGQEIRWREGKGWTGGDE